MTQDIRSSRSAAPNVVRSSALDLDQGRAADLQPRRRTQRREPRRRGARRRAVRRDQGAAAEVQGAVPARPAFLARRACGLRAALRRARRPSGRRQRPRTPGPGADLQGRRHAPPAVRERLALRRHLARMPADGRGAALRRVPAGGRRHDLGQHGRWPTRTLPEQIKTQIAGLRARHSIEASFGAALPIEKRLALQGASTPTPSIRWCARTPRRARRSCSSTRSPRTSRTSTPPTTCASARTTHRAPPSCCTT